jgi:uridine kinase
MSLVPSPRTEVLVALAAEIAHNYRFGRSLVAVDGATGTARFAAGLAEAFEQLGQAAFHARIDDFQRPRAERERRGAASPEGYYFDRYDYSTFRRVLVEPFRMPTMPAFVLASFDAARDALLEPAWVTAPKDAVLLVSGPFLARPELRGLFNYVVYLDAPTAGLLTEQVESADELYLAEAEPRFRASAVVDNAVPDAPRRSFSDSC